MNEEGSRIKHKQGVGLNEKGSRFYPEEGVGFKMKGVELKEQGSRT